MAAWSPGTALQSGSLFSTDASTSEMSSPAKCAAAREHLVEHYAEGPDVRAA